MAKLTVKLITGEAFELEDVELDQVTNRDIIQQMIEVGAMAPESELRGGLEKKPRYSFVDKNGYKIYPDEVKTLSELGFNDGNIIRIIVIS